MGVNRAYPNVGPQVDFQTRGAINYLLNPPYGVYTYSGEISDDADLLLADATAGPVTVNLPAAVENTNRIISVKKWDSSANAVTVDANAAELIDGALTAVLGTQYETVTLACDGLAWFVISRRITLVGVKSTGWTADTGTAEKTAHATYAAGATLTFTDPPTAGEMTALATRLAAVETALQGVTRSEMAVKDALITHGLIGA